MPLIMLYELPGITVLLLTDQIIIPSKLGGKWIAVARGIGRFQISDSESELLVLSAM